MSHVERDVKAGKYTREDVMRAQTLLTLGGCAAKTVKWLIIATLVVLAIRFLWNAGAP